MTAFTRLILRDGLVPGLTPLQLLPCPALPPALRAGLQGLPQGPGFYLETGTAQGQAVGNCVATPRGRGLLAGQGHLPRKSLSFPFPPLTVDLFSVTLFQGTLIFARTLVSSLLDDKHL